MKLQLMHPFWAFNAFFTPSLLLASTSGGTTSAPHRYQQFVFNDAHKTRPSYVYDRHYDYGPVAGDSPVRYNGNPNTSLFTIDTLDMYPNPCEIESYCAVKLYGTFASAVTSAHLSVNITTHFDGTNKTGGMRIEDAFKGWADVVQDGVRQDVPKKGKATVQAKTLILGGWIPEANYTVAVRVQAEEGVIWDLWTEFEMKLKS